ncbi:MAG: hypothetical protein GY894_04540 [Planctomycetes bacterium]|nr:hypothetical protein [Planctomycetota bacterium]MCP4838614.1 hypothetical protein [Planctomycetota bacterium]
MQHWSACTIMEGMRLAAIDVGTQSVKLSVGKVMPDGTIHIIDRHRMTAQLSMSEATGVIGADAINHVAERVAEACDRARSLGAARICVVGTSAPREAVNAAALQEAVAAACGVDLRLITGEEEARLAWDAVSSSLADDESAALVDVGGGSTEVVFGQGASIGFAVSMPMGAVRCADRFALRERVSPEARRELEQWIDQCLPRAGVPRGEGVGRVFATGGTVTVLTMLARTGMKLPHDQQSLAGKVDGATLTTPCIRETIESLASMNSQQRAAATGLSTLRSEVITPGGLILDRVLRWIGAEACEVRELGLRDGMLRRMAADAM